MGLTIVAGQATAVGLRRFRVPGHPPASGDSQWASARIAAALDAAQPEVDRFNAEARALLGED
ncbi:hypothetical protein, partial [Clavibacter michiganensis]|uniref:hypothetical protein n=1 Tax=Clavibacter michiganensis TaxID=28447 RepID=UPI0029304033